MVGGYVNKDAAGASAVASQAFDVARGAWQDASDESEACAAAGSWAGATVTPVPGRDVSLVFGGASVAAGPERVVVDHLVSISAGADGAVAAEAVSREVVEKKGGDEEDGAAAAEEEKEAGGPVAWPCARAWHATASVPAPAAVDTEAAPEDKGKKGKKGKGKVEEAVVEAVSGPQLVVFGGEDGAGGLLGDVWSYDVDRRKWIERKVDPEVAAPTARRYHSADFHAGLNAIVVFGGVGSDGNRLNDVWALDVTKWSWRKLPCYGEMPSPRCWHATVMATLPDYCIPPTPSKPEADDDGGKAADEDAPLPDSPDSNRLLVVGGFSSSGLADSTLYALDLGTQSWSIIPTAGEAPPSMYGAVLATGTVVVEPDAPESGGVNLDNTARLQALQAIEAVDDNHNGDEEDAADGKTEEAKGEESEGKAAPLPTEAEEATRLVLFGGWDGKSRQRSTCVITLSSWEPLEEQVVEEADGELGWGKQVFANGDVYEGRWKKNMRNGIGRCKYADGSVYAGEWKNDMRHGRGVHTTEGGARYEGEWKKDKRHGRGQETFADGDPDNVLGEKLFVGTFYDGGRQGQGTCDFHNGDQYDGNWKGNVRQGKGFMAYGNGETYEGDWENNCREGYGTQAAPDGAEYTGAFLRDLREGRGIQIYSDGAEYRGLWSKDKRNGTGQMTYANRDQYTGKWKAGKRFGRGTQTYAAGHRYEGMWNSDKLHGEGEMDYANGDHYEGGFAFGKRSGQGMLRATNGTQYVGEWKDDHQHGTGKCTYFAGSPPTPSDVFEGEWRRGGRHGKGTIVYRSGDRYVGDWKDDVRAGEGVCTYRNGTEYVGEWANDGRWGHGRLTVKEPKRNSGASAGMKYYEGGWARDGQDGDGEAGYSNGDKYVGQWKGFVRSGTGTCTSADGTVYEGKWLNDMREGFGTCTYPDGTVYEGEWKRDRRHVRKANWRGLDDCPVDDPVLKARAETEAKEDV